MVVNTYFNFFKSCIFSNLRPPDFEVKTIKVTRPEVRCTQVLDRDRFHFDVHIGINRRAWPDVKSFDNRTSKSFKEEQPQLFIEAHVILLRVQLLINVSVDIFWLKTPDGSCSVKIECIFVLFQNIFLVGNGSWVFLLEMLLVNFEFFLSDFIFELVKQDVIKICLQPSATHQIRHAACLHVACHAVFFWEQLVFLVFFVQFSHCGGWLNFWRMNLDVFICAKVGLTIGYCVWLLTRRSFGVSLLINVHFFRLVFFNRMNWWSTLLWILVLSGSTSVGLVHRDILSVLHFLILVKFG